jgi:hypothetical protein
VTRRLDAHLERLTTQGFEHEPVETYSGGFRHAKIPDPERQRDRVRRAAADRAYDLLTVNG